MNILVVLNQNVELANLAFHDYTIGVDGGCRYCMDQNVPMDLAIGDFDSLATADYASLVRRAQSICSHPPEKDHTDFELALHHAMDLKPCAITVCGVWGGRNDHALANLFCLATQTGSVPVTMPGSGQDGYLLKDRQTIHLRPGTEKPISLLAVSDTCQGICSEGLLYPLQDEALPFGTGRGISNKAIQDEVSVGLEFGVLLVLARSGVEAQISITEE